MTRKMTDADRSHLRGVAVEQWRKGGPSGETGVAECTDAVINEVQAWLDEKDSTISALADALERLRRGIEPYRERLVRAQTTNRRELWADEDHLLRVCAEADCALRLAGRL